MKYLCIHGHFYQPPRENAWTGTIEIQESAAPYHDWNERITAECYAPNTNSRVLNADKDLTALVNNYSNISFNFGPTLLSWMEEYQPEVYKAILNSDKESQKKFSGHGGAIAQVYNHIIMPLANDRDKETQIIWGIEDFKARFGRTPEGMWLAETACDTPTLELLSKYGIKFTILAPGQCCKVRKTGDEKWIDTGRASVDPKKPYLCNLPSGKSITLFFYDGPVSQGIAFADTLKSGENFAAKLLSAYTPGAEKETELMHIATDGETYGHHQKFADMALAYCLKYIEDNKLAKITVYGEFLEKNPPLWEAKIFENTSWSCFHGVERWRNDCGCCSGMHPGWNQKWRGPLRTALDFIRDEAAKTFENKGKEYFNSPWEARNAYVSVLLDRSKNNIENFIDKHCTNAGKQETVAALQLMEMQLNALYMYTSCGWFFDEISGIETVQVMQYAARVIELNKTLSTINLEPEFLARLLLAPSNLPGYANGANIYERFIKNSAFGPEKAAVHYAVALMDGQIARNIFSYNVTDDKHHLIEAGRTKALAGSAVFESKFTLEKEKVYYVLFYSHDYRLICFSGKNMSLSPEEIKKIISAPDTEESIRQIQAALPWVFTLSDLFKDVQRRVVDRMLSNIRDNTVKAFNEIFDTQYPMLRELKYIGAPLPQSFLYAAQFVLTEDLKQEIAAGHVDAARIEELMEDARSLNISIDLDSIKNTARQRLSGICGIFHNEPTRDNALTIVEFLTDLEHFPFAPEVFYGQEDIFTALKTLPNSKRGEASFKVLARKMKVAV
ncbi:glycoside hydrolase [Bacteroidia bacterium]|nr:glycoside hydrolase [Bacteroidia bacterium]